MPGILVVGDNHFIVRGPRPEKRIALALARHWSLIQIGRTTPAELCGWQIINKALREDLEWAVLVDGNGEISPAVAELLLELKARHVMTETFAQA